MSPTTTVAWESYEQDMAQEYAAILDNPAGEAPAYPVTTSLSSF
ncbi:MAG: hypothetical protein ACRDS9_08255 [Pseudonocardiaceae bacterium]